MSTLTLPPHLQRALEVMSRDMGVEPQALVSQAVFAWLRINGYVVPGAVSAGAPALPQVAASVMTFHPPPPAVAPLVPPVSAAALGIAPAPEVVAPPVEEAPAPPATPPVQEAARVAEVAPPPRGDEASPPAATPARPTADGLAAVKRRMEAIAADLAAFTKPWPAWTKGGEEEGEAPEADEEPRTRAGAEDQDEPLEDGDRAAAGDGDEADDEAGDSDAARDAGDGADEDQRVAARVGAEDQDEPDEEDEEDDLPPGADDEEEREVTPPSGVRAALRGPEGDDDGEPGGDTGETKVEEPPEEGTFVLRSAPFVLVIEREGEEPVRVESDVFTIGRDPSCSLIINSPRVSRVHVRLTRMGVTFVLEDLGSSNGTWLAGERIERRELESGDVIHLGNEAVKFLVQPV